LILNSVNSNGFLKNAISIYPNPNDGNFTVKSFINGSVEIWNSSGQQMVSNKMIAGESSDFNLNLSSGIYFIKVFNENGMLIESTSISVSK
jgi:hypothetical protein